MLATAMIEVIPTILTNDPNELKEMLSRAEGKVARVQIDIIDGIFADNKTIGPSALRRASEFPEPLCSGMNEARLEACRRRRLKKMPRASVLGEASFNINTNLKLDFHLMVKEPVNWIEQCVSAGADRIIGQIEMMSSQIEFVRKVQEARVSAGLAIDLNTPVSKLNSNVLKNLDIVLVMSVPAGFGGQKFNSLALQAVSKLDKIKRRDKSPFRIFVDGGITKDVINKIRRAGADEVGIGRLFKGNLAENIEKFKKAAYV